MEWLSRNKEWFLSGAGIAMLSAVIYVVRRLYQWRLQRRSPALGGPTEPKVAGTRPYPGEIREALSAAPPLHRQSRAMEYVGLDVLWLCTLNNVHTRKDGFVRLMLLDRGNFPWVYCTVALEQNASLRQAAEGKQYWVKGTIASISEGTIELDGAELQSA